jgi:hypothetical protein
MVAQVLLCELCDNFASFAVKAFNRKARQEFAKCAKKTGREKVPVPDE